MVPGLEIRQKILLRCAANLEPCFFGYRNFVEKVNAKKMGLTRYWNEFQSQ